MKAKVNNNTGRNVFYHFVGASPGSTDIFRLLTRMWLELNPNPENHPPADLDGLIRGIPHVLSSAVESEGATCVLFIDALNQLDVDDEAQQLAWLPNTLPPGLACVVSMIHGTTAHSAIMARSPQPEEVLVEALDMPARAAIVHQKLETYNKELDAGQMALLLQKEGSSNPLWLITACEELRVRAARFA